MQGSIRSQVDKCQVDKCSEVHPAISLVRCGISMLPPENKMRVKQIDILMLNAVVGRGENLPFFDMEVDCGVSDNE